jgi:hypothetical protein
LRERVRGRQEGTDISDAQRHENRARLCQNAEQKGEEGGGMQLQESANTQIESVSNDPASRHSAPGFHAQIDNCPSELSYRVNDVDSAHLTRNAFSQYAS